MSNHSFQSINLSQRYLQIPEQSFVSQLRMSADQDWQAAVHHRFVNELFAGTLSDRVLVDYLIQDYQFFDAFLAMLGACVATSDSAKARLRFSQQLGMLANDEDGYFQQIFKQLNLSSEEINLPSLTAPTQAFLDEMWRAVKSQNYTELLVILTIAEWLYLDWGERDLPLPKETKHLGWIELHRGRSFRQWTQFLIDELNRVTPEKGSLQVKQLVDLWQRIVRIERAFFDAAYLNE